MVERDVTSHPPPDEAEGVRPQSLEHQGRIEPGALTPTPPQRQGQTARPGPAPEVADRVPAPTAESLSLERRTIETQLPGVAPLGTVPPLPIPAVEPLAWQARSLDTRVPEISPTMTPAVPLGFPAPLPRPALQPAILSQALPQVTPYTFTPAGLPFPRVYPVRLVPSRFTQALAFPVAQPGPSIVPVPQPAAEQEDAEEEGGEGNAAGVGLLEWLFEPVEGTRSLGGTLEEAHSWVILSEAAEEDHYAWALIYLLSQVYRCQKGIARVQVPLDMRTAREVPLPGGKITLIPGPIARPEDIKRLDLLPNLRTLLTGYSFAILPVERDTASAIANRLRPELPGVRICGIRLASHGVVKLLGTLRAAFGFLEAGPTTLDIATANLDEHFYQRLKSFPKRQDFGSQLVNPSPRDSDSDGRESEEHLRWTPKFRQVAKRESRS